MSGLFKRVFGRLPKLKVMEVLKDAFLGAPLEPGGKQYGLLTALLEKPVGAQEAAGLARRVHAYAFMAGYTYLSSEDNFLLQAMPRDARAESPVDTLGDEAADEGAEQVLRALPPEDEEALEAPGEPEKVLEAPGEPGELQPTSGEPETASRVKTKEGVELEGLQPETLSAVATAQGIVEDLGGKFVVTDTLGDAPGRKSKTRGNKTDSRHFSGNAFDIRIRGMSVSIRKKVVAQLTKQLGSDYDAVLKKDHIHVEFDPKKAS